MKILIIISVLLISHKTILAQTDMNQNWLYNCPDSATQIKNRATLCKNFSKSDTLFCYFPYGLNCKMAYQKREGNSKWENIPLSQYIPLAIRMKLRKQTGMEGKEVIVANIK